MRLCPSYKHYYFFLFSSSQLTVVTIISFIPAQCVHKNSYFCRTWLHKKMHKNMYNLLPSNKYPKKKRSTKKSILKVYTSIGRYKRNIKTLHGRNECKKRGRKRDGEWNKREIKKFMLIHIFVEKIYGCKVILHHFFRGFFFLFLDLLINDNSMEIESIVMN